MNENMLAKGGSPAEGGHGAFGGKIIFFGTSNVALPILETLHRYHDIAAVVTAPDAKVGRKQELKESPVSVLAKEMDIELLKPEKVKSNSEFLENLKKINADVFIVVSYGKILPLEIINLPQFKTLNVHFSLLPKYRGSSPIQYALLNGEKETGTSIFVLDEKMDTGPIVTQEKIVIDPDDNFITLSQKLSYISAKLLLDILPKYVLGEINPKAQNEGNVSYTKIIAKNDGRIDWQNSAYSIYDQFRAFYPWPGIWTLWNGKKIKILDCEPTELQNPSDSGMNLQMPTDKPTGTVLENGVVVCGHNTALEIRSLQMEGKSEVGILDFLNGYGNFTGSKLG